MSTIDRTTHTTLIFDEADLPAMAAALDARAGFMRVVVDTENNAEVWWDAAYRAADLPAELTPIVRAVLCEVEVPAESVDRLRAWCESLPGWSDGPEYARRPLLFLDARA